MKKKVLLGSFLFFLVLSLFLQGVYADEQSDAINKAMNCLDDRVNKTSLSLEEAIFTALAKTPNNKINETINSKKSGSEYCWPNTGCTVKETAQVAIVKKEAGENITSIIDWLKARTGISGGLIWYLQVSTDSNGPTECSINYDGKDYKIKIDDKMKLSGNPGSCLAFSSSGYWMGIRSSCLDKDFGVSCNESFKSNLLYEKSAGGVTYVSSQTHSAAANAWTSEMINAKCFKTNNACDYEGSLWATSALYVHGEDISGYAPYLRVLAQDNEKYFPNAFLMAILEGGKVNYDKISQSKKQRPEGAYWEMPNTAYNRYYDTSLAMLAFGGADSAEIRTNNVLGYLFANQDDSGCWNNDNLRDTAFLIYAAGWGRSGVTSETVPTDTPPVNGGDDSGTGTGTVIANKCTNGYWGKNESTAVDGRIEKGYCHLDPSPGGCCPSGYTCEYKIENKSESLCVKSSTGGPYAPDAKSNCETEGFFCTNYDSCLNAGGEVKSESIYVCSTFLESCCTKEAIDVNCAVDLRGSVCKYLSGEICTGRMEPSSDGECCVGGSCQAAEECGSDYDCGSGEVCSSGKCVLRSSNGCSSDSDCGSGEVCSSGKCEQKKRSSLWIWIIIFLILIALVVLGIIYKDKLRVWWFKTMHKNKKSPGGRDVGPPGSGLFGARPTPRFIAGRPGASLRNMVPRGLPGRPPMNPAPTKNDKEMEDTFKKLKEMSK